MITQTQQTLIPGRAGELTHKANKLTFELLEDIFGKNGPYRNTLKHFGVKIRDTNESYLVLKDEVVYTDLTKENDILWGNYPYKLFEDNGNVKFKTEPNLLKPVKLLNFAVKSIREAIVILNIERYVNRAFTYYKEISDIVEKLLTTRKLTKNEFLDIYEKIVYVTYLYELLDMYNDKKISDDQLKNYVRQNDYLINDDNNFVEHYLKLDRGFYLDNYANLNQKLEQLPTKRFIPNITRLKDINGVGKTILYEKELQCLKDNLRLKTNVLLFFLNLTLFSN